MEKIKKKISEQLSLKEIGSSNPSKKIVGVIGGSKADRETKLLARELGREIANNGYILVCGGLRGVMEAVCRGAREAGGITIGILPGKHKNTANPFVTIPIVTAMSHARNAIIVRTADILIAVDGRYGTLSEIGLAKSIGKRVIGLNTWKGIPGIERVNSPKQAIQRVKGK
ncbi:MAG: TIGR00725 family protein [Elusimicrobiota bacterium]